jgi:hypothetical protein
MNHTVARSTLAGALLACTAQVALVPSALPAAAQPAPPAGWPAYLRYDLVPKWISWDKNTGKVTISWPPNDGCVAAPVQVTLPPGTLIDRFGSEGGSFFYPKGERFRARAAPYVCRNMDYRVYKVLKPLPVKQCKAAPWFGEPGGALQMQTAEPAYKLVASGAILAETYTVGGSNGPYPQCGGP